MRNAAGGSPGLDLRAQITRALLLGLLSWLLAMVCIAISRQPSSLAFVWLPNALAAIAVIRSGPSGRGALFLSFSLGTLLANLAYGDPPSVSVGLALANLCEVVGGSSLTRRWRWSGLYVEGCSAA